MVVFLKIQLGKAFLWQDGVCGVVEYKGKRNQRCFETGKTGRTGFAENQNFCSGYFKLEIHMFGVRDSSLNPGPRHILRKLPLCPLKSSRAGLFFCLLLFFWPCHLTCGILVPNSWDC